MDIENFLKDLKEYGIQNNIPNISETNAYFIRNLIKISKSKNMLEIGTANGYSSIHFAIQLEKNKGTLTTLEFSKLSYDKAIKNFKLTGLDKNIKAIHGNALEEIENFKEKFDFVFIDGMKRRTKDFFELSWKKTKKNGIIIIDDVIKFKEKMIGFWEYLEDNKIRYIILPIDINDGIAMIIKN